jgi:hypothetical protein
MVQFIAVVAMSLVAGVLLAALACWLSTTSGNRISDIERGGTDAINVQVMDHLKIVSSVPVVALYVVSVACALGLPGYFMYLNRLDTHVMVLEGTFDEIPQQLSVLPDNLHINGNAFAIPLAVTDAEQQFDVNAGQLYAPLTLQMHVVSATRSVYYYVNGARKYGPFDIEGTAAHIGKIHLTRIPSAIGASAKDVRINYQPAPQPSVNAMHTLVSHISEPSS